MEPFPLGGVSPSPSSGRITPGEAAIMDDTDKPPQTGSYRMPPNLTKGGLVFKFLHLGRQRLIDFGRCPSKRLSEGREPEEPPCRAASLAGDLRGASAEGEASPPPASRALRGVQARLLTRQSGNWQAASTVSLCSFSMRTTIITYSIMVSNLIFTYFLPTHLNPLQKESTFLGKRVTKFFLLLTHLTVAERSSVPMEA